MEQHVMCSAWLTAAGNLNAGLTERRCGDGEGGEEENIEPSIISYIFMSGGGATGPIVLAERAICPSGWPSFTGGKNNTRTNAHTRRNRHGAMTWE